MRAFLSKPGSGTGTTAGFQAPILGDKKIGVRESAPTHGQRFAPTNAGALSVPGEEHGVEEQAQHRPTASPARSSGLLERAEAVAQTGSWEWETVSGALVWSENLYRIFGLEPGEIAPTAEYVVGRTHPDDRANLEARLEEARRRGRLPPFEYRIIRADGEVRHLRALQSLTGEGGAEGKTLVGTVQDVTDWRRAERQVGVHLAVSDTLARWDTLEHPLEELLARLCQALDCTAGVVWVPRDRRLVAHVSWRSQTPQAAGAGPLEDLGERPIARGRGLAGSVWQTRRPGVSAEENDSGVVALPLLFGEELLGVLEFYGDPAGRDVTDRLMQSLAASPTSWATSSLAAGASSAGLCSAHASSRFCSWRPRA